MRGQRVLVSGMGGELGSLVASLLENEPWVGSILGIDDDPPRRRLRRAEFHLIEPSDRERIVEVVTAFDPHVLIHLAVWEPDARAGTTLAKRLTDEAATSIIGAAAECRSLRVDRRAQRHRDLRARSWSADPARRRRADATRRASTAGWWREIEETAHRVGQRVGVAVGALRLAPVLGPHVPSPLGRYAAPAGGAVQRARRLAVRGRRSIPTRHARSSPPRNNVSQGPLNVVAPGAITDDAGHSARSAVAVAAGRAGMGDGASASATCSARRCRST